jgi:hypothetical protein
MEQTSTGHEYSAASIKHDASGLKFRLKGCDYGDSLEPGEVEADTPWLVGLTRGKYRAKATLDFATRRDWDKFCAKFGEGLYEQFFTLTHVYSERLVTPTITDTIPLVRIKSADVSASGTDGVGVKVECVVLGVMLWNGRRPIFVDEAA